MTDSPIDAVIAWVDGSDPAHAEKRRAWLPGSGAVHSRATSATRFDQVGEIYLCVASILAFAPFVRTIWIVTDQQRPEWIDSFAKAGLCAPDRIRIVDHRDIFAGHEAVLPTFNSLTIASRLWAIPGLAERFVYFNDDVMLNAPIRPDMWFDGDTPRLHGALMPQAPGRVARLRAWLRHRTGRKAPARPTIWEAQKRGARAAGEQAVYLRFDHHPHPLRVSTFRDFDAANPQVMAAQIAHRFRSRDQFSAISLANHLELRAGAATVAAPWPLIYLEPATESRLPAILRRIEAGSAPFLCLQSLDECRPETLAALAGVLRRRLAATLPPGIPVLGPPS